MKLHSVRVHPERDKLPLEAQLAWKIAGIATDDAPIEADVAEMIVNRVIDSAAVSIAALNSPTVASARAQALAHPRAGGATVAGFDPACRVHAEWAAWANATAVRELDLQDTFLGAEYSHPCDNIAPLLAVAQQAGCDGASLLRGIAAAYEVQVALAKAISLHKHKVDHIAHLGPSVAAGLGGMLGLPQAIVYQAVNQSVHVTVSTRQARKGAISSWIAAAPAHAGKLAIEAVDRAMRGETAPSPIYEGEDSLIAWMLDGPDAHYEVPLPDAGQPKRAILETYTKEHAADYQAQAFIDLAISMGGDVHDWDRVSEILIRTSHHTHYVIGTGANDPQKYDPSATRETLQHSLPYIFAVALQDRRWHLTNSYLPARAGRDDTVRLWKKIRTLEDPLWTKRYHADDPAMKAFGGHVEIAYADGGVQKAEQALPNAHPLGARPFGRADYIRKFTDLTEGLFDPAEQSRFLDAVQRLPELKAGELAGLSPTVPSDRLTACDKTGLF